MTEIDGREVALKRLWWLADSPLFIDEPLITGFYDAIVRPEFELQGKKIGEINEGTNKLLVGGAAKGSLGLPSFLSFLGPNLSVEGKLEHSSSEGKKDSEELDWRTVSTGGRKLEELVAVYVDDSRFQERLLFLDCPTTGINNLKGEQLNLAAFSEPNDSFPRSLVFVELKPGAIIIPTMCEFSRGGLDPLYERLIEKLWDSDSEAPRYPSESSAAASEERRKYWNAISERYDSRTAMEVLERAMKDGRTLDWIDFRVRLNGEGQTLHLHICPKGMYSAGTFGYNFIRRGNKHGLRIVGALKRGPDLNVLAIFEC